MTPLNFQKHEGGPLGEILVDLGHVTRGELNIALAAQQGYELIDLTTSSPEEAIKAVPAQTAQTHQVLPLKLDKARNRLIVAMASHDNFQALDDLRSLIGFRSSPRSAIRTRSSRSSRSTTPRTAESFSNLFNDLENDSTLKSLAKKGGDSIDLDDVRGAADSNPVKKLINLVLMQAIKDKASDIHFEPFEDEFKMRYRIDGVLYEMMPPPATSRRPSSHA